MKKTILKIAFILFCIGAIIFLLLPFLETQAPVTTSLQNGPAQVATSNPLTAIAKRLSSLFNKHNERNRMVVANAQGPNAAREFFTGNQTARFSAQSDLSAKNSAAQTDTNPSSVPAPASLDYGNGSFKTDDGEWVLIRQVAPEQGKPGMHEVNVHDNPYDRFIRQERANRFGRQPAQPQIPDSKWARFTRPIKEFFGIESARPVQTARLTVDPSAEKTARSSSDKLADLGKDSSLGGRTRIPFPDITPQQWFSMTPQEQQQERERKAVTEVLDLLTGYDTAEAAAALSANAKYPNPKTEAEKQQKEEYKQRLTEENKQKIRDGLLQAMQAQAADKPAVDEVKNLFNCTNSSLPSTACSANIDSNTGHPLPPAPLSDDEIAAGQAQNAADFLNQTGFVLPKDLPLTIVYGPSDPETIAALTDYTQDNPEVRRAAELYQFLYKEQNCASQDCFGVTNSPQIDQQMTQAISLTTAVLKEDPLGVYAPFESKFVDYKEQQMRAQLEQAQADEETMKKMLAYAREDAKKQFHEDAPHSVPYTGDQLKQMQENTFAALDRNNPQADPSKMTIVFVGNGQAAPQVAQYTGPYITYHKDSMSNAQDVLQAGTQTNQSLIGNVNVAKGVSGEVLGEGIQDKLQDLKPGINQLITQNNDNGKGLSGLLDAFRNNWRFSDKK